MNPNDQQGADPYASMSTEELVKLANAPQQPVAPPPQQAPSGFDNFANAAGNVATVASQGVMQGVKNFGTGVNVTFRQVTDALGFTDPTVTKAMQDENTRQIALTDAEAKVRGHETIGAVSQFAGEVGASLIPAGAATKAATTLLGGGLKASVAANTLVSAGQSLISGAQADLGDRAVNALVGGAVGGTLAGIMGVAGKLGNKLKVDPGKDEAFRAAGIETAAIGDLLDKNVPPKLKDFYDGIANTLNKVPGLGIKGTVRGNISKLSSYLDDIVKDLDGAENTLLQKKALFNVTSYIPETEVFDVGTVSKTALGNLNKLSGNIGIKLDKGIADQLQRIGSAPRMGFQELWDVRQGLDDTIDALKGNLTKVGKSNIRALNQVRHSITDRLDEIATKKGVAKDWSVANTAVQDKIVQKTFTEAINNSAGAGGEGINIAALSRNLREASAELAERNLVPNTNAGYSKAIANVAKIADAMARKNTPKAAPPGLSGNLQGIGAAAVAAVGATGFIGGDGYDTTYPMLSAAAVLGLGRMITTPSGRKILQGLANASDLNSNKTRVAVSAAIALGQAEFARKDEVKKLSQANQMYGHMSTEELVAIASGQQAPAGPEAPAPEAPPQGAMPAEQPVAPQGPIQPKLPQVQYY